MARTLLVFSNMELDSGPDDVLSDLELDSGKAPAGEPDFGRGGGRDGDGPNWPLIWVVILLVVALLGVYFGFFRGRKSATATAARPAIEAPASEPEAAETADPVEPEIDLPPLEASDAIVRELVSQLAQHPKLATWLASDELLQRFAAAVDNVAEGKSPRGHLAFLAPQGDFKGTERDGLAVVDRASYRRYDAPAQLFASLDAADVAKLYRTLKPLVSEAYRDLGYPSRDFDATLAEAIDELIATPLPDSEVALLPKVKSYEFADPSLEKLSPAQKHLLRMGPDNARRVQRKLAEIRDEIGLEP